MKPAPFDYAAPQSLEEALALMEEHGFDAKILAGGQSLIPVMNFRLAQPAMLVDLNGVAELERLEPAPDGGLRIGAMVRQRALEHSALIAQRAPLIFETMPYIAHPQIRNRGTVGGSLAHADPAGELPVLSVALDARLKLQRTGNERWVDAADFYVGLFTTALDPEEIVTEIALPPLPARTGTAFQELARRHGDYAQAGVAAVVTVDERGVCRMARLVYLNVGDGPMVAAKAAQSLVGTALEDGALEAAARKAADEEIEPAGDVHATAAYKRHLSYVLGKRALKLARERATH